MPITIRHFDESDRTAWDKYIHNHPNGTLYHLSGWKNIIEKTYGHKTFFLIATSDPPIAHSLSPIASIVVGILPLVHMKHFLFGNRLISMPFMDIGGVLADNEEIEQALISEALNLAKSLKATEIELRHTEPLSWLAHSSQSAHSSQLIAHSKDEVFEPSSLAPPISYQLSAISCATKSHKVRMIMGLPESSGTLWKSFKSRFRNKIKKPMTEGLKVKIGGMELLDDFYEVFVVNMRDLGSPVHSKNVMKNVVTEFQESSNIFIIYKDSKPLACSMAIGFKDILENPWASSLKEYATLRPNTLLYWSMLEYASDHGFKFFDFGRSTVDEGTYKFKQEWGARPHPLHWHFISANGKKHTGVDASDEKSKFDKAISYWQKLPVPVTRVIGPKIRKHIGL